VAVVLACAGGARAEEAGPRLDAGGVRLHYLDRGAGEPVVLLHGFAMDSRSNWAHPWGALGTNDLLAALSAHHRVIALDARGHGESDRPHDCRRYGDAVAEDVIRLLDALRIPRAHLVGFSAGGMTATWLLVRHPERFEAVALLAPKTELAEALVDGRDPGMDEVAASLDRGDGLGPRLLRALTPPGESPPVTPEEVAARNRALLAGQDAAALACSARGFAAQRVERGALAAVRRPVLAMVGTLDPIRPGAEALVARIPGARLRLVEGATHLGLLGAAGLDRELAGFLDEHPIHDR
jgi:pimeloyl-ACP methyl ester carboxylesterase